MKISIWESLRKTKNMKTGWINNRLLTWWQSKLTVWHLSINFLAASVIVSDFNYTVSSLSFMVEHMKRKITPKAIFTATNLTDILLDLWLRFISWAMQKTFYRENYTINYSSLTSACYVFLRLTLHTFFRFQCLQKSFMN